jgi:DNA (cytosine-5)-methyltransferase 1
VRKNRVNSTVACLFPEFDENPWPTGPAMVAGGPANLTTLELCAGGGGQALGLEQAGLEHAALVELDGYACQTLRMNRPGWDVIQQDLNKFDGAVFKGVDLISGGLPCPPFSIAGKQLGENDERNLFPVLLRLVDQIRPRAIMIENVRGILEPAFFEYRHRIASGLRKLGYTTGWNLMNACDFGVPQLRPRVVLVAIEKRSANYFCWPEGGITPKTVGETLYDLMAGRGWMRAGAWKREAASIAPTIVGGSHKHGGPDLGPTRARKAWAELGVDGIGIADLAPDRDFRGLPKLTIEMVARIQGFPAQWQFAGRKTAAYRQVGNAFPPPFARAVAERVRICLSLASQVRVAV